MFSHKFSPNKALLLGNKDKYDIDTVHIHSTKRKKEEQLRLII